MNHHQVRSSGLISSSSAVLAVPGKVHAIELFPDATHAASVIIYDNATTNSGTEVADLSIAASTTAPQSIQFNHPITCPHGIYAQLGGTGGKVIVHYSVGD